MKKVDSVNTGKELVMGKEGLGTIKGNRDIFLTSVPSTAWSLEGVYSNTRRFIT